MAVDKPAGQLVHPADTPQADDQVTMKILRDQIGQEVEVLHRLDRPTTGVLLFGLNKLSSKKMRHAFERRLVQKTYWAVVHGVPENKKWISTTPLRKADDAPEQAAETHFRILENLSEDLTLLEASPVTGRYHQIRRHLKLAGLPIVGDFRYAGMELSHATSNRLNLNTRMLLQAKSLTFPHPISKEKITITAPADPFIQKLRSAD